MAASSAAPCWRALDVLSPKQLRARRYSNGDQSYAQKTGGRISAGSCFLGDQCISRYPKKAPSSLGQSQDCSGRPQRPRAVHIQPWNGEFWTKENFPFFFKKLRFAFAGKGQRQIAAQAPVGLPWNWTGFTVLIFNMGIALEFSCGSAKSLKKI